MNEPIRIPNEQTSSVPPVTLNWPLNPTTQGTLRRWLEAIGIGASSSSGAAGSATEIQFNTGGDLDASDRLTFNDDSTPVLTVGNGNDEDATIQFDVGTGAGTIASDNTLVVQASGGTLDLASGTEAGDGQNVIVTAADGDGTDKNGGSVLLNSGSNTGTGFPGNIYVNASDMPLSTSATGGFLVIPTCAGAPTGAADDGSIIYDTSNNKLYVRNGSWKSVTLS